MSIIDLFYRIFSLIGKKRFFQIIFIILLTFINIIFEILTIAAIIPFTEALMAKKNYINIFEGIEVLYFFSSIINQQTIVGLGIILSLLLLISMIFKVFLTWFSNHIAYSIGHEINCLMFNKILNKDYNYFKDNNSSTFLGGFQKSDSIRVFIYYVIQMFISSSLVLGIILFTFYLNKQLITSGFILVLFLYYFFFIFLKKKVLNFSKIEAQSINARFKVMQECFSSIKEIIILDLKKYFFIKFQEQDKKISKVQIFNSISAVIPGQLMIAFILIFITISVSLISINNQEQGILIHIPFLAGLFFSIQRIMPYLQNIFNSFTKIKSSTYSINDALEILYYKKNYEKNIVKKKKIIFKKLLKIEDLSFQYTKSKKFILKNLNAHIKKGSLNGIYGKSGHGKTTLLNIISGLLKSNLGRILIDNVHLKDNNLNSWQKKIFYVPQEPALLDASIIENISYKININLVDKKKLYKCLKIAEIFDFINLLPNGINTVIGENGVKFSGGQRQRIAIARALYHNREILILDEATNALDEDTEKKIYLNIKKYFCKKTIIVVSHRKSIYKFFDNIIFLK
jgi:ABC-type bacteriocin/lantibiotic exporter with double-glycine peptidase domain